MRVYAELSDAYFDCESVLYVEDMGDDTSQIACETVSGQIALIASDVAYPDVVDAIRAANQTAMAAMGLETPQPADQEPTMPDDEPPEETSFGDARRGGWVKK